MMSWVIFGSKNDEKKSQKTQTKVEWWIFESKNMYISKVTWFLEDWVKQMKKDLSI